MSTNISLPKPSTTVHFSRVAEIISYMKHHEKLIGLSLLLIVGWFAYGKTVDYIERRDIRQSAVEIEKLRAQAEKNAELAAQNAKLAESYKALVTQVLAQNVALQQAIAARDTATKKQQTADRTLPPDALADRWQQLVPSMPLQSVVPTADGFAITASGAIETVVRLEEVPRLEGNLKDVQAQAENYKQQTEKADEVIAGLRTEIEGKQAEIIQAGKACDAKLTEAKATARKAKKNWFIRGLAVGAGIVLYAIH
jgi:hypothetical protein